MLKDRVCTPRAGRCAFVHVMRETIRQFPFGLLLLLLAFATMSHSAEPVTPILKIPSRYHPNYADVGVTFSARYPLMEPCSAGQIRPDDHCILIIVRPRNKTSRVDLIESQFLRLQGSATAKSKAVRSRQVGEFRELVIDHGSSVDTWLLRRFPNGDSIAILDIEPSRPIREVYRNVLEYSLRFVYDANMQASYSDVDAQVVRLIKEFRGG